MRVAFVSQPLSRVRPHMQADSIAIWIDQVARRLAGSCEVSVYSPRYREDPPVEICENVEYRGLRLGVDRQISRLVEPFLRFRGPHFPHYASMSHCLAYALSAAVGARRRKCDIIHILNFAQFARVIRAFNPKARIVIHMECEWLTTLDARIIARCLNAADSVVGCSDYIAQGVRRRFPWFADQVVSVWNGVDTDVFTPGAGLDGRPGNTILYVGRISPEKGVHVLVEAFRRVHERRPDSRLEVVGPFGAAPREFIVDVSDDPRVRELGRFYDDRTYLEHLQDLVPKKAAGSVSFVGPVPHTELVHRYRRAAVFVFPSVCDEAFGMPIAEAMACGVPVVASRAGGIPEPVADGVTGRLVDRADPDQLAEAILELLEDESARSDMGAAGRERAVKLFSWDRIADSTLRHYATLSAC